LWQSLPGVGPQLLDEAYKGAKATIMLTAYPQAREELIDQRAEREMQSLIELISRVRNIRSEMNIKPGERISVLVSAPDATLRSVFNASVDQLKKLMRAGEIVIDERVESPKASARAVLGDGGEVSVPLEGLIDFAQEQERLRKEQEKLLKEASKLEGQLSNPQFVERAPAEKVGELRARLEDIAQRNAALRQTLEALA
jgi:valyl-tRNA synthetase